MQSTSSKNYNYGFIDTSFYLIMHKIIKNPIYPIIIVCQTINYTPPPRQGRAYMPSMRMRDGIALFAVHDNNTYNNHSNNDSKIIFFFFLNVKFERVLNDGVDGSMSK